MAREQAALRCTWSRVFNLCARGGAQARHGHLGAFAGYRDGVEGIGGGGVGGGGRGGEVGDEGVAEVSVCGVIGDYYCLNGGWGWGRWGGHCGIVLGGERGLESCWKISMCFKMIS